MKKQSAIFLVCANGSLTTRLYKWKDSGGSWNLSFGLKILNLCLYFGLFGTQVVRNYVQLAGTGSILPPLLILLKELQFVNDPHA
jgi:hypothetical protein